MEGFPSGQRDQTVNLPALPSMVRIRPPPPSFLMSFRQLTILLSDSRNNNPQSTENHQARLNLGLLCCMR